MVRAKDYEEALRLPSEHDYGNGVAIFTRDGDTARDFTSRVNVGMVGVNFADPGAARLLHLRRLEAVGLRRPQPARARRHPLLHQDQDGDRALAIRHQGRRRVRHPDHEVSAQPDLMAPPTQRGRHQVAEYQLYCFAQSGNAYRVALMLNLIGADWEPIWVDFFVKGEQRTPAYRTDVNEMGEAPVLVHGAASSANRASS